MRVTSPYPTFVLGCVVCFASLGWIILPASAQTQRVHEKTGFDNLALRAATARDTGDVPGSIKLYREALRRKPEWQEGWWYLGSLLYDNNRYADAVKALHRLTSLNSNLGAAWALLGLSEFETHDFSQSLLHLERAQRLGVGDHEELADVTHYHLAILLNSQGQCEGAQNLLSNLLLQGKNSEDVQVGLGLSMLRVPLLPAQLDPSRDALIHSAGEIAALIARRQYEQADLAFQRFLNHYPSTPFAHYAYGAMLATRGQEDAAEAQFREETQVTPDSALAYTEWAFIEFRAQHYDAALPLAQTATRLAPGFFMAHYVLGDILLASGDSLASVTQLETARRLAPESPEIRYSLARAYAKAGKPALAKREHAEFLRIRSRKDDALHEKETEAESLDFKPSQGRSPGPPR
jgi:tetratricopeptide (TPR) repeat protein